MKTKILLLFVLSLILMCASAFAQDARKIDEFGFVNCEMLMGRSDNIFNQQRDEPNSKLYILYYGGEYYRDVWDEKKQIHERKLTGPLPGRALNYAREIPLYANLRKFDKRNLVLVDGGYRKELTLEVWLVPKDAAIPKATPTVDKKDVKFAHLKTQSPRNYWEN